MFGGLPISEYREKLCCGIGVVDMTTGKTVATFRFLSGVEEIFAVEVIPGFGNLAIGGSHTKTNNKKFGWCLPNRLCMH